MVCVRERHGDGDEAVNELVAVPTLTAVGAEPEAPRVLGAGPDGAPQAAFVSTPRFSPDGRWLSWLRWNHPRMPWDGTELYAAVSRINTRKNSPYGDVAVFRVDGGSAPVRTLARQAQGRVEQSGVGRVDVRALQPQARDLQVLREMAAVESLAGGGQAERAHVPADQLGAFGERGAQGRVVEAGARHEGMHLGFHGVREHRVEAVLRGDAVEVGAARFEDVRFERELVATRRWLELAAFRVEPASRKQVAVLFQDQTARKREPLLHAARQPVHVRVALAAQTMCLRGTQRRRSRVNEKQGCRIAAPMPASTAPSVITARPWPWSMAAPAA